MSYPFMSGHLPQCGLRAGFMNPGLPGNGPVEVGPSIPIITRGADRPLVSPELQEWIGKLERAEVTGDVSQVLLQLGMSLKEFQRAITSQTTAFPVRENLEAEAKILVPLDTPFRNLLPRKMGSGTASKWKQITSLGGGYSVATTTSGSSTATGSAVSIAVASSAGFAVGDTVIIDSLANAEALVISAIADGTHISLTITVNHGSGVAVVKANVQPGSPQGFIRAFFAESGAPADHSTKYADQSAGYKLLGTFGSVTGFAMASGMSFQNQLALEKTNAIRNLLLNEEYALINGDATNINAPWGDGSNALAFNGVLNLVTTANGTPPNQVQSSVGALTTAHIDAQLGRLYTQGAQDMYMLMNEQETRSLAHLAEASGSIIRVQATSDGQTVLGVKVTGYVHPVSGEVIPILPSRFMSPGTMLFGAKRLPDGSPAADVDVLPQVQLPVSESYEGIQGYTAQEIAASTTSPQVFPFLCSVYEVLRVKSALHFGKSVGVTPV